MLLGEEVVALPFGLKHFWRPMGFFDCVLQNGRWAGRVQRNDSHHFVTRLPCRTPALRRYF